MGPKKNCPQCEAPPVDPETDETNQEVRNYDAMWGDGDVHCKKCGAYVRLWDRG